MDTFREELNTYTKTIGKLDALFTLVIYHNTREKFIELLNQQLKKVKNMSATGMKKKLINDRLFNTIKYVEELKDENMQHVFLIGENVNEIKIPNKLVSRLAEYNVEKYYFSFGNRFEIDDLQDMFFNMEFYPVIRINKHHVDFIRLNKFKHKLVQAASVKTTDELNTFIKGLKEKNGILHGIASFLSEKDQGNLEFGWSYQKKSLDKPELILCFEKKEAERSHQLAKDTLAELQNPAKEHLFVFGKQEDIVQAIEEYRLKELYCHPDTLQELKTKVDENCFNFEIIKVPCLEKGDMGDTLLNTYNGAFGISYY
jgi:hypothetical protein